MEHWRLCDPLSLEDAAALLAGYDPEEIKRQRHDTGFDQNHPFLYTMETALRNAVLSNRLKVTLRANTGKYLHIRMVGDDSEGWWEPIDELSLSGTLVNVDDLKEWLASRGFTTGFFFDNEETIPGYLDPKHQNYAPKLAAAIEAWEVINGQPERLKNTTPKQAIANWLESNADRLQLTKDDGTRNELAIEEIAKVANWKPGGAARTPE